MLIRIDASRKVRLLRVARTIFTFVAVIAIAAAVDLVPGKFAELSTWGGLGLIVLAAGSPNWLLDRCLGQPNAHRAADGQA